MKKKKTNGKKIEWNQMQEKKRKIWKWIKWNALWRNEMELKGPKPTKIIFTEMPSKRKKGKEETGI